jgi:hypothetical protein
MDLKRSWRGESVGNRGMAAEQTTSTSGVCLGRRKEEKERGGFTEREHFFCGQQFSRRNCRRILEYFDFNAIDGRGRLADVPEHLERQVGSLSVLNNLIATHWRPHDLKPFDKDAPDKDDLARTSPSERAYALSHVASWKGVI